MYNISVLNLSQSTFFNWELLYTEKEETLKKFWKPVENLPKTSSNLVYKFY